MKDREENIVSMTSCCENVRFYVFKVDSETGVRLAGAMFTLVDSNGNSTTGVTGQDGTIYFELEKCIDYVLTETQAPSGYQANMARYQIRVNQAGDVSVNGIRQSCLTVANVPVGGVEFTMTYNPNGGIGGIVDIVPERTTYTIRTAEQANVVRPGYIFLNWNTSPDGTGLVHLPGTQLVLLADVVVYAIWILP